MTEKQALAWVRSMRLKDDPMSDCAVDLCVHDIENYGLKNWLRWTPIGIAKIFLEMAEDSVGELVDEIESQQVGEYLIDEVLGVDQNERVNTLEESKKLALSSIKMFRVLHRYHRIHEFIKIQYDEERNTY
jgi:hypothetical protein|tara:strand:- start:163 stop:555 length:393 start_codon:yes stop_codon:yes gene_type:complete